jgi:hypothetical protein
MITWPARRGPRRRLGGRRETAAEFRTGSGEFTRRPAPHLPPVTTRSAEDIRFSGHRERNSFALADRRVAEVSPDPVPNDRFLSHTCSCLVE